MYSGYNSALDCFLCSHSSSFGCWELSFSSCISLTYPIFVGFCIFFFFLAFPSFWCWKIPQVVLAGSLSQPWNQPFLQSLAPLLGNEWSWEPRPGCPCAPSLWTLLANRTTRRVCQPCTHAHCRFACVQPGSNYTAPESSLMPSSTSYPRVALPSVTCDLPPALRPSAPTRRLCGPRAWGSREPAADPRPWEPASPQGTVLCARPGPSRLQTPLTATRQLTGLWLGPR